MVSEKKFNLKKVLVIIIAALLAFSAISMAATKIIYDSIFARTDIEISVPPALSQIVSERETRTYLSGENRLSGYLYRSGAQNKNDTLIILAPGFHAEADSYLYQIESLLSYGWSVFAFDPTGCGASEGSSSVGFSQELSDLEATIKYVELCSRFGYNDIVLLGHSRGGYAACCALSLDFDISAVVSVSGINSSMEAVIGSAESKVGPIAYGNYGFLWLYQTYLFGAEKVNMSADEIIENSDVPVLIIHGEEDKEVPPDKYSIYSHRDEIEGGNADFLLSEGGHTDLLFSEDGANEKIMSKINEFLKVSLS